MPVTGKMERIGGETDPFFPRNTRKARKRKGGEVLLIPTLFYPLRVLCDLCGRFFLLVASQQRGLAAEGSEVAEGRVRVFYREIHERRERNRGPLICLSIVSFLRVSVVYTLMAFL